jgi:hypothetical protein
VIHQGPLPYFLHGVIDYLVAALLIAAPFLFNFHGTATAVSIVAGVIVLVVAATTVGSRTSLVHSLPLSIHILFDFVGAGVLIAVPFIFSFSHQTNPTAFFIVLGVVSLLVDIATRFPTGDAAQRPKKPPKKP